MTSPDMTRCSRCPDSSARLAIMSISRRVIAEMIADDSSKAVFGRNFALTIRSITALVSRKATDGSALGFSGPWMVTR